MATQFTFRLKVRRVDQSCIFDLSDCKGQELAATLTYAEKLTEVYQNWQQIYHRRYELRSRARVRGKGGSGTPAAYDWDRELKVAEKALLDEFDNWLGQAELLEIREKIQQEIGLAAQKPSKWRKETNDYRPVSILLDCTPLNLARLPWEAWKLASKDAPTGTLRIARTLSLATPPALEKLRRGRVRVLAILGDAPDLNQNLDRKALHLLHPLVEIEFIQCQLNQKLTNTSKQVAEIKQQIAEAIADEQGWDILFFAGHSDEAAITGGKLELAPSVFLSISEIELQLSAAKQRGLQLAVFNSCCGLHIAESLIRLGLRQVVVMRERIQDQVAHVFLRQFCQNLAKYEDVHAALLESCQYLASEQISYPSAYLIPSLFRHPDPKADLFRIEPSGLNRVWQQWRPTRWEMVALGVISLLSLMTPVQEILAEQRAWIQAIYRDQTQQLPPATPLVAVVAIDQDSIYRDNIDTYKINPMDRTYLAKLTDRLQELNVRVIGLDYFLDAASNDDRKLKDSLQTAIQKRKTWFVFVTKQNDTGQIVGVTPRVASPKWVLQGDAEIHDWNVMLPAKLDCQARCPFAYQLALAQVLQHYDNSTRSPQPQLQSADTLQKQVTDYISNLNSQDKMIAFFQHPHFPLGLQPIIDFSLPPDRIYQQVSAEYVLHQPRADTKLIGLQHQVVLIASGGYDRAEDNYSVPMAVGYWRFVQAGAKSNSQSNSQIFTGGEALAYTVHHLLSQHFVLSVPDLWLVGVAVLLGKGTTLLLLNQKYSQRRRQVLLYAGATAFYGGVGLQIYISAGILLPWFFPSAIFWIYIIPTLKK